MSFYGAIEQLLSGWIFEVIPASDTDFDAGKGSCRRDDLRRPRAAIGKVGRAGMDNDIVKRLVWSGVLAASSALASIAADAARRDRLAARLRRGPARVGDRCPDPAVDPAATEPDDKSVAELVFDVSEQRLDA